MTITDSRRAIERPTPLTPAPAGPDSPAASVHATPNVVAPQGPDSRAAKPLPTPDERPLRESNSHATGAFAIPEPVASRGSNSRPASMVASTDDHAPVGSNSRAATGGSTPRATALREANSGRDRAAGGRPSPNEDTLLDPALALAADFLDDVERVKIANENRLRSLTRVGTDADGVDRYIGLDVDHPVVAQLATMVESLATIEHAATLNLQRMVRKHPLGPWIKATKGVGEKQGARLLAVIGDPYWRPEIVREDGTVIPEGPRTVSALWAYCGLHVLPGDHARTDTQIRNAAGDQAGAGGDSGQVGHDSPVAIAGVAARRRKGQQANWSTKAKTRAYLIAEASLKTKRAQCEAGYDEDGRYHALHLDECVCSPYRLVYDRRKSHTSLSRPEWTDGHRHADALRVASKEVLKDLWRAGREWHLKNGREATS